MNNQSFEQKFKEATFMTRDEIEALPRQGRDTEHVLWADHYDIVIL